MGKHRKKDQNVVVLKTLDKLYKMGLIGENEKVKIKRRRRKKKAKTPSSLFRDASSNRVASGAMSSVGYAPITSSLTTPAFTPAQHESMVLNNKLTALAIENAKNPPKQIEDGKLNDAFKAIGGKLLDYDHRFGSLETKGSFAFNKLYEHNDEISQLKARASRQAYVPDEEEVMRPSSSSSNLKTLKFDPQVNMNEIIEEHEKEKKVDEYLGRSPSPEPAPPLHMDVPKESEPVTPSAVWTDVPTPVQKPSYVPDEDAPPANVTVRKAKKPKPEPEPEPEPEPDEPEPEPEPEPVKKSRPKLVDKKLALIQEYDNMGGLWDIPPKSSIDVIQGYINRFKSSQKKLKEYEELGGTRKDVIESEDPVMIEKFIFIQSALNDYQEAGGKDPKVLNSADIKKIQKATKDLKK
jgi:hypothetical protein